MIWNVLHEVVKYYYLNAPLRLGGSEGADIIDICSTLTSLPSSHWHGEERRFECGLRITRAVDSWTTALLYSILVVFLTSFVAKSPEHIKSTISGVWSLLTKKAVVEDTNPIGDTNQKGKKTRSQPKTNPQETTWKREWFDAFIPYLYDHLVKNPDVLARVLIEKFKDAGPKQTKFFKDEFTKEILKHTSSLDVDAKDKDFNTFFTGPRMLSN